MICEKARNLHNDLLPDNPSIGATVDGFKARRGWLDKFHKRSGIHSVIRQGSFQSDTLLRKPERDNLLNS